MNLRKKYIEETGKDAIRLPHQNTCNVTSEYVEWLEQQLRQYNVVRQSEQLPPNSITDKEHKKLMNALYPKDNNKRFRR